MALMYIIFSQKFDKNYIGTRLALKRRQYEHNIGHSKFTKTGIAWVVRYKEGFIDLSSSKIGSWKSRLYIEKRISS